MGVGGGCYERWCFAKVWLEVCLMGEKEGGYCESGEGGGRVDRRGGRVESCEGGR